MQYADSLASGTEWLAFVRSAVDLSSRERVAKRRELEDKYFDNNLEDVLDFIDKKSGVSMISRFIFDHIILSDVEPVTDGKKRSAELINALESLRLIEVKPALNPIPEEDWAGAFSTTYGDRTRLVHGYSKDLRKYMAEWRDNHTRVDYNAPYTSMVNASMMGKSRLIKQLCEYDPVIYFCLRSDNLNAYPLPTMRWAKKQIQDPGGLSNYYGHEKFGQKGYTYDSIEEGGVLALLYFFANLLECLNDFLLKQSPSMNKRDLRIALWYLLGEPTVKRGPKSMEKDASNFWVEVQAGFDRDTKPPERTDRVQVASSHDITERIRLACDILKQSLCDSHNPNEQVIVMVFDEARRLTQVNLDNRLSPYSKTRTSRFRLLRRSLRKMGENSVDIFSIMTDTSSRLANFQSKNDINSTRKSIVPVPGPRLFDTIHIMPTVDLGADNLVVTCDPAIVQDVKRLMLFGRVAWSVMNKKQSSNDLLDLAITKLIRCGQAELGKLFKSPEKVDNSARKFLACLGPRLAFQIGSFCQDARELVASHMMSLEHVGDDHVRLFTRYLSEPILAEASARATAEHGWEIPLEYLGYKVQEGVVKAGFRGELVTKVILCMAVEDAQRARRKESELAETFPKLPHQEFPALRPRPTPKTTTELPSIWTYSTVISVREFLNSLLRQPTDKRKRPHDEPEPETQTYDTPPMADDAFVERFLLPKVKANKEHLSQDKYLQQVENLLNGSIFFNHWIRREEPLLPSVLIKAWNRNAALMCQEAATGIDFVIPIVFGTQEEVERLGNCTSWQWTEAQERAASERISCVLIQTKARDGSSGDMRMDAMINCVPLGELFHKRHPNFLKHTPKHPFLSILFEFRTKPPRASKAIEYLSTRATLAKRLANAVGHAESMKDSEEIKTRESAMKAVASARRLYNLGELQIPLVVYTLDGTPFKILESRPGVTEKLKDLLNVTTNLLDRKTGPPKEELLYSRVCVREAASGNKSGEDD